MTLRGRMAESVNSGWFSYVTIFLLQLKIIWGVWLFRDLPTGDTSYYFISAYEWYRDCRVLITWSPLYTAFYGTLLNFSSDAYVVTIAHRLIIVLVLALLVLALMRCLLPPGLAWLMAAWWVLLPIDFNALYEVHLFAVIPLLGAFLVILWKPGPRGRGLALAILLVSAVLIRNELLFATGAFAVLALGWEVVQQRRGVPASINLSRAYGIPLLSACLLIAFFYERANDRGFIRQSMESKHTLNICQVYAYGYEQRYSDWKESPWTECHQLMTRVFGKPEPSLMEALRSNPRAMFEHFWWNIQLIPNGIQVLLFNGTSGKVNPDYVALNTGSFMALLASLITLVIVGAGLLQLYRERRHWWEAWLSERSWAWLAMACVASVVPIVMVTQRPRPSYMFVFGIMLRAAVGMCALVVFSRFEAFKRAAPMLAIVIVLLILLAPPYYYAANSGQPLLKFYRRLAPYQGVLEHPNAGLVVMGWPDELCNYLGKSRGCRSFPFRTLRDEVGPNTPWDKVLDRYHVTLFFADEGVMRDMLGRQFVLNAGSYGWKVVAMDRQVNDKWAVLERVSTTTSASGLVNATPVQPKVTGIVEQTSGITLGKGWYNFERYAGEDFRWVNNDAELEVHHADPVSLLLTVEGGPGLGGQSAAIEFYSGNKLLQTVRTSGRQTIQVNLQNGEAHLRLHVNSPNRPIPGDPRILNFRVFGISVTAEPLPMKKPKRQSRTRD